jgi:peptidoglycan hydrolase-like protein with peptidoglycan-binding domain
MIPDYLKNGSSYGGWNPLKWGGELGYWWGSRSTDTSGGIYTDPDTGEQIPMQEMQDRMIAAGMLLVGHGYLERSSITGVYGTKTYNAVVEFQTDRGMSVDGRVGPDTLSVISVPALPAVSPPREAASPPEASILQPPKKLSDEAWFWPAVMGSGAALAIGLALYLRGRK